MAKSARETALSVLERCRRDQAFSDALLSSSIQTAGLSVRDSAFCSRLCYGVMQNMLLCDFYIDSFTLNSNKLEPKIRDILRLSVYQILFLDRVPSRAAVNEGVELCKKCGFSRASALVNAVLRKISENKSKLPEIPRDDICRHLSIKYSTPLELTGRFISEFGADFTEKMLAANNEIAPTVLQVNTLKVTADKLKTELEEDGIELTENPVLTNSFEITGTGSIAALREYMDGEFYVQDAAARLSVIAAAPKPGDSVLDACSAPGGKSFASAIMMENSGKIVACDIHASKLSRVTEGAERLGINIISTAVMDAAKPDLSHISAFDIVIADVPCSGLGVIRKKPDIRYKDISEIDKLPTVQFSILSGLAECVKPGGVLLYSTCTVLSQENDGVIDRFLSANDEFSLEAFTLPLPFGDVVNGRLRLYPHLHRTDGFFICKLRKKI